MEAEKFKTATKRPGTARELGWTQDPDRVRRNILEVARTEFAEKGLSGARVDDIASSTDTSKRMIYYYFGSKQGLYVAVLEEAYIAMRAAETALDLTHVDPVEALTQLIGVTFDHHAHNPYFVRLVMIENIHHGKHLKISRTIALLNLSAISIISDIYKRGVAAGVFRTGIDPMQIHLTISALSFYNVSNRHSIATVFGLDMNAEDALRERRTIVVDTVLRYLAA